MFASTSKKLSREGGVEAPLHASELEAEAEMTEVLCQSVAVLEERGEASDVLEVDHHRGMPRILSPHPGIEASEARLV